MKPPLSPAATTRCLVPHCSGDPAAKARLQGLINGMADIDTSQEDPCVRRFQAEAIMPDPATREGACEAQCVLEWCAHHQLVDQFLMAAEAYGAQAHPPDANCFEGESLDLEFEKVAAKDRPFFIAVLPHCPRIKGIDLPIPSTSEQATALADALARNSGLNWLQLHGSGKAPPDSTVLYRLFSYYPARANALSELRIHIKDKPAGDTDWMRALRNALSTHLKAESARLTLPWDDGNLAWVVDAIRTNQCPSSLTLGGSLPRFGMLELVDALKNSGGQLASLSFPDSSFDKALADALINAVGYTPSLTRLELGKTPLTSDQHELIDKTLRHNRQNIERWRSLGGPGRV